MASFSEVAYQSSLSNYNMFLTINAKTQIFHNFEPI